MKNPFRYGGPVTKEHFADRKREIREIVRDLRGGANIFLISPRRYGKSSLILNVLSKLNEEGAYTVYIDLYKVSSYERLLTLYARAVTESAETKVKKFAKIAKEFLPNLHPKIVLKPDGSPSIEIDYNIRKKDIFSLLNEVYDIPQRIAEKRNKNFVVVFDEFQEIRELDSVRIEKEMRASFQYHDRVAYLFAGSKKHILYDMVTNKAKPFYNMGRVITLKKLPRDEFCEFLYKKFKKTGFSIKKDIVETILEKVEDYPYNAQFLCHRLWSLCLDKREITIKDIDLALEEITENLSPTYISLWDNISMHQRNLLLAISLYEGKNLFSQDFILENNLGNPASVQTSLKLLQKKGILDKENGSYFIMDVFFKEWIKRRIS
jgi:hypothetical protein